MVQKLETRNTSTAQELKRASLSLEGSEPQEIIRWGVQEFLPDITLACSFGGVSGMALLDMTLKINPETPVFYIDTHFLFPETYALKDQASRRYGFKPQAFAAELTREEQAAVHGDELWAKDPDRCCEMRKVQPNVRALAGRRAWISGLRRDQDGDRRNIDIVAWDGKFNLVKVNPLANWTEAQVWRYVAEHGVPYNALHDRGYPSIGCTFCTKSVKPGEDPRSGRWAGFEKNECGIHVQPDNGQVAREDRPE